MKSTSNNSSLHLVYATDKGYLLPTIVASCSAAYWVSAAERIVIDILDCGFDDNDWEELCSKIKHVKPVAIARHVIDMSRFDGYNIWNSSRGIYARLLLPEILKDADWCVYCDSDTLLTDDPLKLLEYCDERYALVGHEDNDNTRQREWFPAHGMEWDQTQYVCAGFTIQNLKWMRAHDAVEKLFAFIEKYRPPLNDQDAYYAMCKGCVRQLNDGWGVFGYLATQETMHGCIHYASSQPWKLPYTPHRGLLDVQRLWFVYAKRLCGYGISDCCGKNSLWRYTWLIIVSKVFHAVFAMMRLIPVLRPRALVHKRQCVAWKTMGGS